MFELPIGYATCKQIYGKYLPVMVSLGVYYYCFMICNFNPLTANVTTVKFYFYSWITHVKHGKEMRQLLCLSLRRTTLFERKPS